MMKRIGLYIVGIILLSHSLGVFAQGNEIDASILSTPELNGTARYKAMAGAFGALGGDLSVMSHNPAGLGIYRSSEIAGTLNLSTVNTSTDWRGHTWDMDKTNFSLNNLGFEFYFPTSSNSVRSFNIGFMYNRLKNFNRRYTMENRGMDYSLADYAASKASNTYYGNDIGLPASYLQSDNYYNINGSDWLPALSYQAGLFEHFTGGDNVYQSAFGQWKGNNWEIQSPNHSFLNVTESGHIDEYDFSFGTNISNFMFLGASLSVTDISYRYRSTYGETFDNSPQDDHFALDNALTSEGAAVGVSLGAIMNLQMLRFGVAYNSPRWYSLTDYYWAGANSTIHGYDNPDMRSETPESSSEYNFRTPGRWIFSGALILGQSALFSVDYELSDYSIMSYSDRDGYKLTETNDCIKEDFGFSHTVRIGTEIKATPQFAVRAGYMMQTSPMKSRLTEVYSDPKKYIEVYPSGTIPHYTVIKDPTHYICAGLGYRFTPNFYMDLAAVYRTQKADVYAFSNMPYEDTAYDVNPVHSIPASLKTNATNISLTLGYKF